MVNTKGIKNAIDSFNQLRKHHRQINRYVFDEWVPRDMGYVFLANKRRQEAVHIFKLNTRLHPRSWQAYKDLADAYMRNGQEELAVWHYEKAKSLCRIS